MSSEFEKHTFVSAPECYECGNEYRHPLHVEHENVEFEKLVEALQEAILVADHYARKNTALEPLMMANNRVESVKAALLAHEKELRERIERLEQTSQWLPDIETRKRLLASNTELRAENERLKVEFVEVGHKYGWNGVTNSKILSTFFDAELQQKEKLEQENAALREENDWLKKRNRWLNDTNAERQRLKAALEG